MPYILYKAKDNIIQRTDNLSLFLLWSFMSINVISVLPFFVSNCLCIYRVSLYVCVKLCYQYLHVLFVDFFLLEFILLLATSKSMLILNYQKMAVTKYCSVFPIAYVLLKCLYILHNLDFIRNYIDVSYIFII